MGPQSRSLTCLLDVLTLLLLLLQAYALCAGMACETAARYSHSGQHILDGSVVSAANSASTSVLLNDHDDTAAVVHVEENARTSNDDDASSSRRVDARTHANVAVYSYNALCHPDTALVLRFFATLSCVWWLIRLTYACRRRQLALAKGTGWGDIV